MLLQENIDELAMLETLDNGKPYKYARTSDLPQVCLSPQSHELGDADALCTQCC